MYDNSRVNIFWNSETTHKYLVLNCLFTIFVTCDQFYCLFSYLIPDNFISFLGNGKLRDSFSFISVSPESVVIPIVSCIFGFPLLALLVICCLRRRAKLARERDRRRNYDLQDHAVSLVRFSPIHRLSESKKQIGNKNGFYF